MTSWQCVAYQIEDITPEAISSLQTLFKNKVEEHEITMLKGTALKVVLKNTLSSPIQVTYDPQKIMKSPEACHNYRKKNPKKKR